MATNRNASDAREALADLPQQIAALRAMSGKELRDRYREIFGEPSRSNNRDYLRKKLAWRIQADLEGGLSQRALDKIAELAPDAPVRTRPTPAERAAVSAMLGAPPTTGKARDPRLPAVGAVLRREHRGEVYEVVVLDDGFSYAGKHYQSLSRIARTITGTPWNGLLFFNLTTRKRAGGTAR